MRYEDHINEHNWYFVHFMTQNFQDIQNLLKITINDMILKDTFILYLTINQLEKIQKFSLVKMLEPSDKFIDDVCSIENTDFFHVKIAPNTFLPLNNDLYMIVRQDDDQTYIIRVNQSGINDKKLNDKKREVIKFLTSINSVKFVSTFIFPTIKNNINTGFTQKNLPISQIKKDISTGIYYFPRYINEQGITGKNQIITILDTPIDPFHAMFRDDDYGFIDVNQNLTGHRKFVYYGTEVNSLYNLILSISENEHGTHVAGIAAGKSICQNDNTKGTSIFNGNAPDAKILYAGKINAITPLKLAQLMHDFNSKISSNSWGVDGFNDIMNYQYGKIAYDNPGKLFLFASGNEFRRGFFSICDPGGSKNVLTVGAIDDFYETIKTYKIESMNDPSVSFLINSIKDTDPWIERTIGTTNEDIVVIDTENESSCENIENSYLSIIYIKNSTDLDWILSCNIEKTNGIFYTNSTENIEKLLQIDGKVRISDVSSFNESKTITHANYSSAGPANKGIIKPDVMAPGTRIISAKSRSKSFHNHGCRDDNEGDFTYMNGTSMATPNIAGSVALVNEYFQSGKWNGNKISLNSDTMRALIINSCNHPNNSKKPDVFFGHGVVDISTILPFDSSFGVQLSNQEDPPNISDGGHLVAQIDVKSNKIKLQITMSYLDPMLDENSIIPIAHDLDLVVESTIGRRFLGDCLKNNDTQHFSTNEKVIINTDEIDVGTYYVHIFAGPFVKISNKVNQSFAVVATGDIDNKIIKFGIPTTGIPEFDQVHVKKCACDNCSSEFDTKCQCDNNHIGSICQAEIIYAINDNQTISLLIHPNEISRVKVSNNREIKEMKIRAIQSDGGNSSIWIDKNCHVSISEYETYINNYEMLHGKIKLLNKKEFCMAIFNNNYESAIYQIDFILNKPVKGLVIGVVFGVVGFIIIIIVVIVLIQKRPVANYSYNDKKSSYHDNKSSNDDNKLSYSHDKLNYDEKSSSKKIEKTIQDINELQSILLEKDNIISELEKRNSDQQNIIDEKETLLNEKISENSELKEKNSVLTTNINEIQATVKSIKKEFKTKEIVYIKQIKFLEKRLDKYEEIVQFDIDDISTHMQVGGKNDYDTKEDNNLELDDIFIGEEDESNQIVEKKIGEGATSISYKVIDKRTLQVMCKKVVKRVSAENAQKKLENSLKEITALKSINHPCICRAFGINLQEKMIDSDDPDETTVALFLEYIPYKLSDFIKSEMMSNTLKMKVAIEIAYGMHHLHSIGMIHRDLKIENVMLNHIFEAKIIDFDLVHITNNDKNETLTKGIGTNKYMSPEMLNEEKYDNKTDVYSYGIFLFVLFTGDLPNQKMSDKIKGKPIQFPSSDHSLNENFIDLVNHCTILDPKKRPSFEKIIEYMQEKSFNFANEIDLDIIQSRFHALDRFKKEFNRTHAKKEKVKSKKKKGH